MLWLWALVVSLSFMDGVECCEDNADCRSLGDKHAVCAFPGSSRAICLCSKSACFYLPGCNCTAAAESQSSQCEDVWSTDTCTKYQSHCSWGQVGQLVRTNCRKTCALCTDSTANITVDLTHGQHITKKGAGILASITEETPYDSAVVPLSLRTMRAVSTHLSTRNLACNSSYCPWPFTYLEKLNSDGTQSQIILFDVYRTKWCWDGHLENFTCEPGLGLDQNFSIWDQAVAAVLQEAVRLHHNTSVTYDIFNEPNHHFSEKPSGDNFTRYLQTWDRTVRSIRQLQPHAKIVGPCVGFETDVWNSSALPWIEAFLVHTARVGTLPDAVCWHEMAVDGRVVSAQTDDLRKVLSKHHIECSRFSVNEHIGAKGTWSPGVALSWLSALEGIQDALDSACRACWGSCCDGSMDGLLTPPNDTTRQNVLWYKRDLQDKTFAPRSVWWAYRWYAEIPKEWLKMTLHIDGENSPHQVTGLAAMSTSSQDQEFVLLLGRWGDGAGGFGKLPEVISARVRILVHPDVHIRNISASRLPYSAAHSLSNDSISTVEILSEGDGVFSFSSFALHEVVRISGVLDSSFEGSVAI